MAMRAPCYMCMHVCCMCAVSCVLCDRYTIGLGFVGFLGMSAIWLFAAWWIHNHWDNVRPLPCIWGARMPAWGMAVLQHAIYSLHRCGPHGHLRTGPCLIRPHLGMGAWVCAVLLPGALPVAAVARAARAGAHERAGRRRGCGTGGRRRATRQHPARRPWACRRGRGRRNKQPGSQGQSIRRAARSRHRYE